MIVLISAEQSNKPALENHQANKRMKIALEQLGVEFVHAEGVWGGQLEASFIVRNVRGFELQALERLALKFQQDAVLIVSEDDVVVTMDKPEEPYTYDAFNNVFLTTDVKPMNLYI